MIRSVIILLSVSLLFLSGTLPEENVLRKLAELSTKEEYPEVFALTNRELSEGKSSTKLLYYKALCFRKFGQYNSALYQLRRAMLEYEPNSDIYAECANVFAINGDHVSAKIYYTKAVELDTNNSYTYNSLGAFYFTCVDNDSLAYINFRLALKLDKENIRANYNLGIYFVHIGKHEEAIPYLLKCTRLNERSYCAYFNLGLCYEEIGQNFMAISCFESALKYNTELYPFERLNETDIYWELVDCCKLVGNDEMYYYYLSVLGICDEEE